MINFVSNLPEDLRTGGFSAMNAAACAAIRKAWPVAYVGPIDPPVSATARAASKALRACGVPGDFAAFSERRLEAIARRVQASASHEAQLDFFHGLTPWISTRPARPYVAWSDCTFHDYIQVFHRGRRFRAGDLRRIERQEAQWLAGASRVLFTSAWAAERAIAHYGLDRGCVGSVGIFGEIDWPERDAYAGGGAFVFVSTDFAGKGGPVALAALRKVQAVHPQASLVIVGDPPPRGGEGQGVRYAGFLRKEVEAEALAFRRILGAAVALTHPTSRDMSPLVLVEAAGFGCPAISSRAFAIPEIVEHGRTGWLLDDPSDAAAVAAAMIWMLDNEAEYGRMRREARARARVEHARERFEQRLQRAIGDVLAARRTAA